MYKKLYLYGQMDTTAVGPEVLAASKIYMGSPLFLWNMLTVIFTHFALLCFVLLLPDKF